MCMYIYIYIYIVYIYKQYLEQPLKEPYKEIHSETLQIKWNSKNVKLTQRNVGKRKQKLQTEQTENKT